MLDGDDSGEAREGILVLRRAFAMLEGRSVIPAAMMVRLWFTFWNNWLYAILDVLSCQ